jgi:hypothetical protein
MAEKEWLVRKSMSNKPVLPTATIWLDDVSLDSGRRHIGQPLASLTRRPEHPQTANLPELRSTPSPVVTTLLSATLVTSKFERRPDESQACD